MQKKLAAGMVLAFVSMPAAAETGFYTGLGAGIITLEDSIAGLEFKGNDTGIKAFGGYRFNEYASIEATYIDVGTPDDTVMGITVESDARAIQGSLLWQVPINQRFEAFVRASIVAWEAENSAAIGSTLRVDETDGTDFGYGIGVGFSATPRIGLRAEFEGAEFDGTDLRAYTVSGVLRF